MGVGAPVAIKGEEHTGGLETGEHGEDGTPGADTGDREREYAAQRGRQVSLQFALGHPDHVLGETGMQWDVHGRARTGATIPGRADSCILRTAFSVIRSDFECDNMTVQVPYRNHQTSRP
jgi:hypothetical protein